MLVQVTLHNRVAVFRPSDARLRREFSYVVPGSWFSRAYREGRWDGKRYLMHYGQAPSGLFLALRPRLEEAGWSFRVNDRRSLPRFRSLDEALADLPQTRPYQRAMVESMIRSSGTGGLVLSATGTGKTFLAGLFLRCLRDPALFVVDELTLLEQTRRELEAVTSEEVGKVGEGVFDPRRITVATVQTISGSGRPGMARWLASVRVVIVDEVHLALNDRTRRALARMRPLAVYGLTATLETEKDPVLFEAASLCGPVIGTYEYESALRSGHLCRGVLATADYVRDIEPGQPWADSYTAHIVRSRTRNDLVEHLARLALDDGRRVCILVSRIEHIRVLHARLRDVPHEVVYGAVDSGTRDSVRRRMDSGALGLIIANRVFEKGVNIKALDCIVDATMGRSANGVRQRFGRGVRLLEGKSELVYVDVGDVRDQAENVFERTTEARRKALAKQGVPVVASVALRRGEGRDGARRLWQAIREALRARL